MALQMNVATYDDAANVTALGRVKRLAKHTDARIAVVHEDVVGVLTVEVINARGEPSRTRETWAVVEVDIPFLPPDQQAGQTPNTIPQEVVSDIAADDMLGKGLRYSQGGGFRWQQDVGNDPLEQTDPRLTVRISPLALRADVGDVRPDMTFTKLTGRDPDLTFNGSLDLELNVRGNIQRLTLTFVNGVATMPVKTTLALDASIQSTSAFKVEDAAQLQVFDNAIG